MSLFFFYMHMKLIGLPDIHGNIDIINHFKEVLISADMVLLAGDVTHFGRQKETDQIITKIKQYQNNILVVPGNCDYPEVGKNLSENSINLDCRFTIFNGIGFLGIGGSLPCPGPTPYEYDDDEYQDMLKVLETKIDESIPFVVLSHQPPFNTINDKLSSGVSIGSKALRNFIEKWQPLACFCGHIHEGVGVDEIGKTKIINAGPAREGRYSITELHQNKIVEVKIY